MEGRGIRARGRGAVRGERTGAAINPRKKPAAFVQVEGDFTQSIKLTANDLAQAREIVKARDGAKSSSVKLLNNFE